MVAAFCVTTATWEAVVIAGGRVVGYGSSPDYGVAVEAAILELGPGASTPPSPILVLALPSRGFGNGLGRCYESQRLHRLKTK